jgi:GxxExxY protein
MGYGENTSAEMERAAAQIVDAAFKVHRELGPGILESVYETCLAYELTKRGLKVSRQVTVPILYDGQQLDNALRLDLMVEDCIIVEVKAVEKMIPLFEAQALTYLKLTGKRLAFLINFNVPLIKNGIKRIIR